MKPGEIRYCACGCGEPAKRCYSGKRKESSNHPAGHTPLLERKEEKGGFRY